MQITFLCMGFSCYPGCLKITLLMHFLHSINYITKHMFVTEIKQGIVNAILNRNLILFVYFNRCIILNNIIKITILYFSETKVKNRLFYYLAFELTMI